VTGESTRLPEVTGGSEWRAEVTGGSARLFVALQLPEVAVSALESWADTGLGGVPRLRRMAPAALHVTLCFLGSQPVEAIEAIAVACRAAVGGGAPVGRGAVDLRLGAPLWLPRRRPRLLAVGLEDPSGGLADLQGELAAVLERGGWYSRETRPFWPHVTVGRFGRAGGQAVELVAPPAVSFAGVSVSLLRSHPGPDGSRYELLAAVALEATG
jgi:2'-5' RNA ligase